MLGLIRTIIDGIHSLHEYVRGPYRPPVPTVVGLTIDGVSVWADTEFEGARFESQVNGVAGTCKFRVRDLDRTKSFTTGQEILLTINGQNVWRGFVSQVDRVYAFPALNVTDFGLARFIDITGADINLLLVRRIVFDQGLPTNTYGTLFPVNTPDTTAIADLVANFLDLTGDGIDTTTLVENVGYITVAQEGRAWSAADKWADAMGSIARLPGAIFYLDPDKKLVYTDVDSPSAPFDLSDDYDSVTSFGYREMEILADGTGLANDVLAWGIGYGPQIFKRDEDAASQAEHGLWQTSSAQFGVYKQRTLDYNASSILNGSPENLRGAKDDRMAVTCVTYEPGLRVADKVTFTSTVFGFTDVIPVRKMAVVFEAPATPRYELTLSHEIDTPFDLIDNYLLPNFGGFGTFGGGGFNGNCPPPFVAGPGGACILPPGQIPGQSCTTYVGCSGIPPDYTVYEPWWQYFSPATGSWSNSSSGWGPYDLVATEQASVPGDPPNPNYVVFFRSIAIDAGATAVTLTFNLQLGFFAFGGYAFPEASSWEIHLADWGDGPPTAFSDPQTLPPSIVIASSDTVDPFDLLPTVTTTIGLSGPLQLFMTGTAYEGVPVWIGPGPDPGTHTDEYHEMRIGVLSAIGADWIYGSPCDSTIDIGPYTAGTLTLTVDGADVPLNSGSPYYYEETDPLAGTITVFGLSDGQLVRVCRSECSYCSIADPFDRTLTAGWGESAIDGLPWSGGDQTPDFSVTPGHAVYNGPGVSGFAAMEMQLQQNYATTTPTEMVTRITLPSGGADGRFQTFRITGNGRTYAIDLYKNGANLDAEPYANHGAGYDFPGFASNVLTSFLDAPFNIRLHIGSPLVQWKIWKQSDPEPALYTLTANPPTGDENTPGFGLNDVVYLVTPEGIGSEVNLFAFVTGYVCGGEWVGGIEVTDYYVQNKLVNHAGDPQYHDISMLRWNTLVGYQFLSNGAAGQSQQAPSFASKSWIAFGGGNVKTIRVHADPFYGLWDVTTIPNTYIPISPDAVQVALFPAAYNPAPDQTPIAVVPVELPIDVSKFGVYIQPWINSVPFPAAGPFSDSRALQWQGGQGPYPGGSGGTPPAPWSEETGYEPFVIEVVSVTGGTWVSSSTACPPQSINGLVFEDFIATGDAALALGSSFLPRSAQVWVAGLLLRPGIDYTEDPTGGIVFTVAPVIGTAIHVVFYSLG